MSSWLLIQWFSLSNTLILRRETLEISLFLIESICEHMSFFFAFFNCSHLSWFDRKFFQGFLLFFWFIWRKSFYVWFWLLGTFMRFLIRVILRIAILLTHIVFIFILTLFFALLDIIFTVILIFFITLELFEFHCLRVHGVLSSLLFDQWHLEIIQKSYWESFRTSDRRQLGVYYAGQCSLILY